MTNEKRKEKFQKKNKKRIRRKIFTNVSERRAREKLRKKN